MKGGTMVKTDGIPEVIESFEVDGVRISIITPAFKIEDDVNGPEILKNLERYGKVSHKSEGGITPESAGPFLKRAMAMGHFSILEHEKITVRVICDRGVTHEWVRHRIASYTQESTRYCNYGKLGFQYIHLFSYPVGSLKYEERKRAIIDATRHYLNELKLGSTPQEARGDLPNSLKTEIIVTHNIREWRHFFYQRCDAPAHPQIREIAVVLLKEFQKKIPVLFDDFEINEKKMTANTTIVT